MIAGAVPVLSCAEARELETRLFGGDETREWAAMQRAGTAIAQAVLRDGEETGGFPADGRLLVLAGKGHNGGDALIAARVILERFPAAQAEVVFAFGERALRPLALRAWRELSGTGLLTRVSKTTGLETRATRYDVSLDGVFGFQFRPPADERLTALLERVNALPVRLRAAIDLPSADRFRADFTYATGSVKAPIVDAANAGRVRYLDLGFFDSGRERSTADARPHVLTSRVLAPLAALRPAWCDKRTYGHVFLLGGSRSFPGAILMSVLAALRSGAGLVTAFVPESLVPAYAARAPEAMWVGWPETPAGALALEGEHLLRERIERASALVIGPGLTREPEALALAASVVKGARVPVVIDADAQQPDIVRAGAAPRIVTPHAGELARIESGGEFARNTVLVLKGPVTRIVDRSAGGLPAQGRRGQADRAASHAPEYLSFFGGPVLARGGSGDLLAGLIGGLLAQQPAEPLLAAARGVVWHGLAADLLARARGQVAVHTTELLDRLAPALRAL